MTDTDSAIAPHAAQNPKSKRENRLSRLTVKAASPGKTVHDGFGLYLHVSKSGAKKFSYRFTCPVSHRVTEFGIGSARTTSLAEARSKADDARKLVAKGINPITAGRKDRKAASGKPTFGECAEALLAAKASGWRNERHRGQWRTTLEVYAKPLWGISVDQVDTAAVLAVLQPIWQRAPETASRLRGRIEAVLNYGKAHEWRSGENPAAWRGHLALMLPKRGKLSRGHHAAMAFDDVPAFIERLRDRQTESIAAMALEFLILTAGRTGEILGARWDEFDLESKVWSIPATRMKSGVMHRVPLPARALAILKKLAGAKTGYDVFPGQRRGAPLSAASMTAIFHRMNVEGVTVHGMRSSFRDWCADVAHAPREIAESCLAHSVGSAVEQSYLRSDVLERRRILMTAWGEYCERKFDSNVVHLTR